MAELGARSQTSARWSLATPRRIQSKIEEEYGRIFDRFLHFNEKCYRFFAVDRAVIVAQREIHHWPNDHFAIPGDRALLDGVHAEDAALRRVEDRRAHERSVDAAVRDREGAAL